MKKGICDVCRRTIELVQVFPGTWALKRHGRDSYAQAPCPGTNSPNYMIVFEFDGPKQPGIGKRGTAPCGHEGEHVTMNMVVCPLGCAARSAKPFVYTQHCAHNLQTAYPDGLVSCDACGKITKYPP